MGSEIIQTSESLAGNFEGLAPEEFYSLTDKIRKAEGSKAETVWRDESVEDYQYYAGDQDSPEVLEALEEQDRPATVFNEIKTRVDTLIGLAGQHKYSHKMNPVGPEDAALAELASNAIYHYRRKLKLADKELSCFEHTVKSGRSMLWFYVDMQNPFKPKITPKRIPGDQFVVDPNSTELDMSDATFVAIDVWVEKEQLEVAAPDIDIESIQLGAREHGKLSYYNEIDNLYRIVECWYKVWKRVYWFKNPLTGNLEWLLPKEFKEFERSLFDGLELPDGTVFKLEDPLVYKESTKQIMKYVIFAGNDYIIEHGTDPYPNLEGFPGALYGAYKDDDNNSWFGAIRMAKDPQFGFNTMRRQLQHLLQTLPKGMLIHEVGTVLNIDDYEENSAKPNFHLEVAKGQFDKVKFEQQPTISSIYQTFGLDIQNSIKDAIGVPDNLMGITASREPGVTLEKKQLYAFAVLYILFGNYARSRLRGTEILFKLMQQYVTEAEIIRIEGPTGEQLVEINSQMNPQSEGFNDISAGEFDLELGETIESSTMRQATAQILVDYAHNNPNSVPPDVLLEYTELPYSVVQRIREYHDSVREQEQANIEAERELKLLELRVEIIKAGRDPETLKLLEQPKGGKSNG